jgi:hypothetical protein
MRQPVDQRDSDGGARVPRTSRARRGTGHRLPSVRGPGRLAQRGRESEWPVTTGSVLGPSFEEGSGM